MKRIVRENGHLTTKAFIDSEAELDDYVARIRDEIEMHLDDNARVRIQ